MIKAMRIAGRRIEIPANCDFDFTTTSCPRVTDPSTPKCCYAWKIEEKFQCPLGIIDELITDLEDDGV